LENKLLVRTALAYSKTPFIESTICNYSIRSRMPAPGANQSISSPNASSSPEYGDGRLHEALRHLDRPHQRARRERPGLIRHVRIVEHGSAAQLQNRGRKRCDLQVDAPQPDGSI
jgi:hypothetical protein